MAWVHMEQQTVLLQAWPVACAMDIAVAYYVLKSISRRSALLPFVLLLGIATNIFGVVVMALQGPPVETRTTGMALALVGARTRAAPARLESPDVLAVHRALWNGLLVGVLLDRHSPCARISADRAAAAARAAEAWTYWPRRPTTMRPIISSMSGTISSRSCCFSSAW